MYNLSSSRARDAHDEEEHEEPTDLNVLTNQGITGVVYFEQSLRSKVYHNAHENLFLPRRQCSVHTYKALYTCLNFSLRPPLRVATSSPLLEATDVCPNDIVYYHHRLFETHHLVSWPSSTFSGP